MPEPLRIPKLGNSVEDVTIIEWLVEDGAQVAKGQEVLEIETDKSTFAVEATADGYIHLGPYGRGDVVPVFTLIAVIGSQEDVFPKETPQAATEAKSASPSHTPSSEPAQREPMEEKRSRISPRARRLAHEKGVNIHELKPTGPGGRIIERDVRAYLAQRPVITPIAQKMATEAGVDIRALQGTGIGGRITKKDVLAALEKERPSPQEAAPPPVDLVEEENPVLKRIPLTGIRKVIAQRMDESVHTTARVTLVMDVDATEFVHMRERLKAQVANTWGFAPGYNDLLAFIVARTLPQFPYMNARLTEDAIEILAHVNLGIAVDTDRGLLVPNIKHAEKKSLRALGETFRELVQQARSGRIAPDHLHGGTFTITNLGSFDVDAFTPVINLPEAAILGVGRIAPKPVVKENDIVIRQMMTLSLVFDHRLVDGAPAARFLQAIKGIIEEPYLLWTMEP